MKKELVSIIVPIYNVEHYLDRCLKSLIAQTYNNIEILLIDDGSKDSSGIICDVWGKRDARIRVFHKLNGGLSDARNYGLQKAKGNYVCFVDSDDWCDSRFIEVMLETLLKTESDIVECDYLPIKSGETITDNKKDDYRYEVYCGREGFYQFLTNVFFVIVWNKMYRKEIIENELFQVGVYHEDEAWTYKIFSKCHKVCRIRYTGYYYYQRDNSLVHGKLTYKRVRDAFVAAKARINFIELHYSEYESVGYSKMMYTCMYWFNMVEHNEIKQKRVVQKEFLSYFRSIFMKYLKKKEYEKEMWRFFVFLLCPKFYCRLFYR